MKSPVITKGSLSSKTALLPAEIKSEAYAENKTIAASPAEAMA